ncbi:MAG: hypothetical protein ABIO88_03295 [Burkholderiaceae bacterium]
MARKARAGQLTVLRDINDLLARGVLGKLGESLHRGGQHQCTGDHDCRKGGRHD